MGILKPVVPGPGVPAGTDEGRIVSGRGCERELDYNRFGFRPALSAGELPGFNRSCELWGSSEVRFHGGPAKAAPPPTGR